MLSVCISILGNTWVGGTVLSKPSSGCKLSSRAHPLTAVVQEPKERVGAASSEEGSVGLVRTPREGQGFDLLSFFRTVSTSWSCSGRAGDCSFVGGILEGTGEDGVRLGWADSSSQSWSLAFRDLLLLGARLLCLGILT